MVVRGGLLVVLFFVAPLVSRAAGRAEFCDVKVRLGPNQALVVEPDWCRTASSAEFERRLTAALTKAPREFSGVSLFGPLSADNLADLGRAWAAACRPPSSQRFGRAYARSATVEAVTRAFSTIGVRLSNLQVDNFYPASAGPIRAPSCRTGLMQPVIYFTANRRG
jgi:hypothetical protein